MTYPTKEEQIAIYRKTMGLTRIRSYFVYGKTYSVKKHLEDLFGCYWSKEDQKMKLENVPGDHPIHKFVKENPGLYLKEI